MFMRAQCAIGGRGCDFPMLQSTTVARRRSTRTTGGSTSTHHPAAGLVPGAYIPYAHGSAARLGGTLTGAVSSTNVQAQTSERHVQYREQRKSKQLTFGFSSGIYLAGENLLAYCIGRFINAVWHRKRSLGGDILKKVHRSFMPLFFYHACSFQRPDRRSIGSIVTRLKMFELPRSLRA